MLAIQLTKRNDGGSVLRCVRADGSFTWQKQERHASFFALHDLTHFAVESTLGCQLGFFGLIAEGWDIDDTTGKGKCGPLPGEAFQVEHIVGMLDAERASGVTMTAGEIRKFSGRELTEDDLRAVRSRCAELFWQWRSLAPGLTLELQWKP